MQDPNKIDDTVLDLIGGGVLAVALFVLGGLTVALGNMIQGIGMGKNVAFTIATAVTLATAWLLFEYLDAQV